jgi:hypothetical protein
VNGGDGGGKRAEEEEGWDLRTGEVEAQQTFLKLLELTDVVDEPGRFFNDDASRAARVIAEGGGGGGRARRGSSASTSNGGGISLPSHQPGQPRQRRRSTLSVETTE